MKPYLDNCLDLNMLFRQDAVAFKD